MLLTSRRLFRQMRGYHVSPVARIQVAGLYTIDSCMLFFMRDYLKDLNQLVCRVVVLPAA